MIAEPMIEVTLRVANSLKEVAGEAWHACANPVNVHRTPTRMP